MKKTLKKSLSLILAIMLVFASVPLGAFAASGSTASKIQNVTFSQGSYQYVSMKSLDANVEYEKAEYESDWEILGDEWSWSDMYTFEEYMERFGSYSLWQAGIDEKYEFEITLTNGRKKLLNFADDTVWISPVVWVRVNPAITYADYLDAKENGKDEIRVIFELDIYNTLKQTFLDYDEGMVFEDSLQIVPCFVESITPVSAVPDSFYDFVDTPDISGIEFKIKYGDGTEKTATAEKKITDYGSGITDDEFYLDGTNIYSYIPYESAEAGKPVLCVEYIDAVYEKEITYKESPFEKIEITDCDLHPVKGLESISYKITWKNGDSKEYKERFYDITDWYDYGGRVETVEGGDVYIYPNGYVDLGFEEEEGKSYVVITLADCVDYAVFDFEMAEPPLYGGYLAAIIHAVAATIMMRFEKIFSMFTK